MFVALIAFHKQFAEIIVEYSVVIGNGRAERKYLSEYVGNQLLFGGGGYNVL